MIARRVAWVRILVGLKIPVSSVQLTPCHFSFQQLTCPEPSGIGAIVCTARRRVASDGFIETVKVAPSTQEARVVRAGDAQPIFRGRPMKPLHYLSSTGLLIILAAPGA